MAKTGAETQRERLAAGKCCSCSESATHGVRCERHWLEIKEKNRHRYLQRKEAGLCGMCGKNPKPIDAQCCLSCREKQNDARRIDPTTKHVPFDKPYHQRNKEAGYCTLGGETHERPEPGKTLCAICLDKKRIRSNTTEAKQKRNEYKAQKYHEKLEIGICVTDGCNVQATHGNMCEKHRLYMRVKDTEKAKRFRDIVFDQYGGYSCHCPGCTVKTPEFIQLDHINNDGGQHRREIGGSQHIGGRRMYYWLKKNGWPKIVQPMCANCNFAKGHYGACPLAGTAH